MNGFAAYKTVAHLALAWLLVVLSAAPWLFGGVLARHQFWLAIALLIVLTSSVLVGHTVITQGLRIRAAWWGLLGLLLIGGLHLVPLGHGVHQLLSPTSLQIWQTFSLSPDKAELLTSDGGSAMRFPMSVYPAGTRADLARWALPMAVVLAAYLLLRSTDKQLAVRSLGVLAVNGAVFTLFGILQQFTSNGKLYWTIELEEGGIPFGAFVNRNHAAAFLNLCLAASLGWLMWLKERRAYRHDHVHEPEPRVDQRTEVSLAVAWLLVAACVGGVILTLSRSGTIAAAIAAVTILIMLPGMRHRAGYRNTLLAALVLGVVVASWLGGGAALRERFEDLSSEARSVRGRIQHWQDAMWMIPDFWMTGTGLGTYRYAYRPYEQRFVDGWFYHAENQYLEAAVETGIPGLILLLVVAACTIWLAIRGLFDARSPQQLSLGVASTFGLTAVAVQALFDFNLQMPAVAMTASWFVALAWLNASGDRHRTDQHHTLKVWSGISWLAVGVTLLWTGWSVRETAGLSRVEAVSRIVSPIRETPRRDPERVGHAIDEFTAVLRGKPTLAAAHLRLADLQISAFRSAMYAELQAQVSSTAAAELLWEMTDLISLHGRASDAEGGERICASLVADPRTRQFLRPAFESVKRARQSGPLLARAHFLAAQLSFLFESPAAEVVHRDRCLEIAGYDPRFLFTLGLLDLQAGRREAGVRLWQRCLENSPKHDALIIRGALKSMSLSEFANEVLPTNALRATEVVLRIINDSEPADAGPVLAAALEQRASELQDAGEQAFVQGTVHLLRGDTAKALVLYEQAVEREPRQAGWRLQFAKLLLDQGDYSAARKQTAIGLRLDPHHRKWLGLAELLDRQQRPEN